MDADRVRFTFDGEPMEAPRGLTIGGALLANGVRSWRLTRARGEPRGVFCAIGVCFDCLVEVGDSYPVRACVTPVRDGDVVRTSRSAGSGG